MEPFDFSYLLPMTTRELLAELSAVHSELATLHAHIAFLKSTAPKDTERFQYEGTRDGFVEKKFLILTLLTHGS